MAETAVDDRSSRRRRLYIAGGLVAVVGLLAGLAAWWFVFRDDAPPAVDLGTAVAQLDEDLDGADPVESGESDTGQGNADLGEVDISGEWTVDNSIGTFDYETATGSFAGFRVNEELTLAPSATAGYKMRSRRADSPRHRSL
jgi:hypothetical protein